VDGDETFLFNLMKINCLATSGKQTLKEIILKVTIYTRTRTQDTETMG